MSPSCPAHYVGCVLLGNRGRSKCQSKNNPAALATAQRPGHRRQGAGREPSAGDQRQPHLEDPDFRGPALGSASVGRKLTPPSPRPRSAFTGLLSRCFVLCLFLSITPADRTQTSRPGSRPDTPSPLPSPSCVHASWGRKRSESVNSVQTKPLLWGTEDQATHRPGRNAHRGVDGGPGFLHLNLTHQVRSSTNEK